MIRKKIEVETEWQCDYIYANGTQCENDADYTIKDDVYYPNSGRDLCERHWDLIVNGIGEIE